MSTLARQTRHAGLTGSMPLWGMVAICVLAAAGAAVTSWRRSRVEDRVYRVGVDHAPPYQFLQPGRPPAGLAVDVMQEAARRKGIRLQFVELNIPVDDAFRQGLVDLWPAATDTPERHQWLYVADPWLANRLCIVSRAGSEVRTTQDLAGKRVSVLKNRIMEDVVGRSMPAGMEIQTVRGREAGLVALCRGEVDASVLEQRYTEQALLRRPAGCESTQFHVINAPGADRMLTILADPRSRPAAIALREGIASMMSDGTFSTLFDRWSAFSGAEMRQVTATLEGERTVLTVQIGALLCALVGIVLFLQNRRLRAANLMAASATRAKSEFLASMSHEIRTPMNGILGMVQLLLSTPLSTDQREQAEIIRDSGDSLLLLINDILDFSKIEAGKLRLEEKAFNLHQLATQVVALFTPQAEAKGLAFRLVVAPSVPGNLMGDPERIRQVLLNLVGNSVKFTDRGLVSVHIDVHGQDQARAGIRIVVSDSGIGIPSEKVSRLFEKFYQADSSNTRRHGGTGLGLAISHQLVTLMGGRIDVQSSLGVGSTFTVYLTLKRGIGELTAKSHTEMPPPLPVQPSGRRILLVEDNLVNQRVGTRLLEKIGCHVDVAENGQIALRLLSSMESRRGYDLVLMDCQMPVMDGFEATQSLRRMELHVGRRIPVVAMTASTRPEDRQRCIDAGMDDYLAKPIQIEQLRHTVDRWSSPSV